MFMNRKTRSICHGRMGKGNNRCSRVIGRVLAESLLGAVKSTANRDITIRLNCHWYGCFYSFSAQNWINLQKKLEMATGIQPFQYKPVVDINLGIDLESSSDEEVS